MNVTLDDEPHGSETRDHVALTLKYVDTEWITNFNIGKKTEAEHTSSSRQLKSKHRTHVQLLILRRGTTWNSSLHVTKYMDTTGYQLRRRS